jgi:RNA polymerase sigma-70 factor (ECF subfamily)
MTEDHHPLATDAFSAASLTGRVQARDPAAEEELVRRFRPGLVAIFRARTRDPEAARELAQDTLLAVIAAIREGKVRDPERLAGFVHGVARNVLAGHFRRNAGRPSTVPIEDVDLPSPVDDDASDRREIVRRALDALGAEDREVLELTLGLGLQPAEIAERLGLTPDAVRMRKMRATRRAAEMLREWLRSPAREPQS